VPSPSLLLQPKKPQKLTVAESVGRFIGGLSKGYTKRVAEMIGVWTLVKPMWQSRVLLSKDTSWPDYVFLDALRRGKAPGLEIGGLFCMPIAQTIASYAFSGGISVSLIDTVSPDKPTTVHEDGKPTKALKTAAVVKPAKTTAVTGSPIDYTNMQLRRFVERYEGFLVNTVVDSYSLAEQYIFVNPDCTLSVASPETVNVNYSKSDFRRILDVTVTTKYPGSIVQDVYTDTERSVYIKYYDGRPPVEEHYENLIGRIPMIHLATDMGPNEVHGRAIYDAALPLMYRYDDVMFRTTDGVAMMGNPIPAFIGLDNPQESLALNSTQEQYIDEQGNTQTRNLLRFDRNTGLVLGKGGDVKLVAPPVGFTKDSLDTLNQLFLLLLNHTRIPQFIWGGAITSSKASTETQLPPFVKYIKYRRLLLEGIGADNELHSEARGGLLELFDIWLRTYKLLNPSIVVGPVKIEWPEIDAMDELVKYQYLTFASSTGKITDEDFNAKTGLWDDPAAVTARATGEPQRRPQYDDYDAKLKQARLDAAKASTFPADDNGDGWTTDYPYPNPVTLQDNGQPGFNPWSIVGYGTWEGEVGTR